MTAATDARVHDQPATPQVWSSTRSRVDSIDLLRGIVMVVMVLDHTREFVGQIRINPVDLSQTTVALYFTRWVTHFCAPVFVLLAGTGSYLAAAGRTSKGALSGFLFTRGVWLIVVELTLVRLGLTFDPGFHFIPLTVVWAIGVSMIVLSVLVYLPTPAIAAFGLLLIAGHDAFDAVSPETLGAFAPVWRILHVPGLLATVWGRPVFVLYPLVPWIGVMAAGYALGALFQLDPRRRQRALASLGIALTATFAALRATNVYGDPSPWTQQATPVFTALSFLNCGKYPPSLLFLLMTVGPALVLLSMFDRGAARRTGPLVTFGRVPLYFYLLQWYLLHGFAIILAWLTGQPWTWLVGQGPFEPPPGYGHDLPFVYAVWIVTVALLYLPCAWFAELKRRRRSAWLSYL